MKFGRKYFRAFRMTHFCFRYIPSPPQRFFFCFFGFGIYLREAIGTLDIIVGDVWQSSSECAIIDLTVSLRGLRVTYRICTWAKRI